MGPMLLFRSVPNVTFDPGFATAALLVRYYVDGEAQASIEFQPGMAAGTGFDDPTAPWGTKWIGHGAHSAWFHNFKVPFGSSIRVTVQSTDGLSHSGFFIIVRGGLDLPLQIGEVSLPQNARLQLQRYDDSVPALGWLDVISVPKGMAGQIFLTTLAVENDYTGGIHFLEGCCKFPVIFFFSTFEPLQDRAASRHVPNPNTRSHIAQTIFTTHQRPHFPVFFFQLAPKTSSILAGTLMLVNSDSQ